MNPDLQNQLINLGMLLAAAAVGWVIRHFTGKSSTVPSGAPNPLESAIKDLLQQILRELFAKQQASSSTTPSVERVASPPSQTWQVIAPQVVEVPK